MTVVDNIVDCIRNKYMIQGYYDVIITDDRSLVIDFITFGNKISNKLGNCFKLYKNEKDCIIFTRDNIYILIEYVFIDYKNIQYEINMFS